jgi:hypothetical protein
MVEGLTATIEDVVMVLITFLSKETGNKIEKETVAHARPIFLVPLESF